MKEKIGMEKLIELLNEYEETKIHIGEKRVWENNSIRKDGKFRPTSNRYPSNYMTPYYIISKEYGFIKWLVENDKIDRDEIIINSDFMPIAFDRKGEKYEWSEEKQLLMLLSISDTPIEDLLLYLK